MRGVPVTIVAAGKQYVLNILSVCVCVSAASVIQHAEGMRLIGLSSVANPAGQNFYTLVHKHHDFRGEKVIELKMCVFTSSAAFLCNIATVTYTIGRV